MSESGQDNDYMCSKISIRLLRLPSRFTTELRIVRLSFNFTLKSKHLVLTIKKAV